MSLAVIAITLSTLTTAQTNLDAPHASAHAAPVAAVAVTPVVGAVLPTPGAAALMASGLAAMFLGRRR